MPKLCPFHAKVYGCEERNLIPVHCHDCWYTNSNERLCEMAIAKALAERDVHLAESARRQAEVASRPPVPDTRTWEKFFSSWEPVQRPYAPPAPRIRGRAEGCVVRDSCGECEGCTGRKAGW